MFGFLKRTKNANRRQVAIQPGHILKFRLWIMGGFFVLCFTGITSRAILIQWFPIFEDNLNPLADKQYNIKIDLAPYRGIIFDRRQDPLAISTRLPSVFINPRVFQPTPQQIEELSHLLNLSPNKIKEISDKKSYFSWLARKINKSSAEKIKKMDLKGLEFISEPKRFYPSNSAAANLIGAVGLDDRGLTGLELQYNSELAGTPSKLHLSRDARGKLIFKESHQAVPETPGNNLHLTIDKALQEIAEEELELGVHDAQAIGGFIIISDPHTGKILALANYPNFNPNQSGSIDMSSTVNKALMDGFEAGSVIKTFVIAEALRERKITAESKFDCENGKYEAGGVRFSDSHEPPTQFLTVRETLVHSSNVCIFKIAETIGPESLYHALMRFGFGGKIPGLHYPGEAKGYITAWQDWKAIRFANIAFGQGFFSNALEITQAYGAIANGGNLMKPVLVQKIESATGQMVKQENSQVLSRVLSPENARTMRSMLTSVVEDGVKNAQLKFHTSAGKTGTSEKVDPKTKAYSKNKRLSSFVGMAPGTDPHIVIYVAIDEPQKAPYYGNLRAAPVFKKVAERALAYLNVAPDKIPEEPTAYKDSKDLNQKRL